MKPTISNKAFDIKKYGKEVFYETNIWVSDFEFNKVELSFFKALLKTNLFKSQILNLFERLQLLLMEVDRFEESNTILIDKVKQYNSLIESLLISDVFRLNDENSERYYQLVEEVFLFNRKYKNFKRGMYEFIEGII